ncbi:phosphoribosylaminoimidazolesuccinocarboxamide synthase [Helicobacter didelphidarum]|uniref:Phosphoribosylaminoimidazole-succinocarboxamide synthase n=1 Tax=Helicobacter didelphidarum TaxID=2040648 RepID=A0A3D8IPJ7_9HELI|nr:phosphoribosylaminoimidazolesuccinocarboxamide synthase [Helicobacter didelphidarum]
MQSQNLLYEGKGKRLYKIDNTDTLLSVFKDDLTAFNAQKKSSEKGKGSLNCQISSQIFKILESKNIKTHFIQTLNDNTMLCKKVQIIPIEVVVRNIATGSLIKRLGIAESLIIKDTPLRQPLVEFYYKDDALGDPIITDSHCLMMNLITSEEIKILKTIALQVNEILQEYFDRAGLNLIDFKLEFGRDKDNTIILADEISPDSCRLWDKVTHKKMDKDIFRQNLGSVTSAYKEVLERLNNL